MDADARRPLQAIVDLEQRLESHKGNRNRKLAALAVIAACFAGGYSWLSTSQGELPPARYVTAKIESRDILQTVESSGKLRPVKEVQVGTQVSGRVVRVLVDFNARVTRGQLLAEIDPSLFGAQVNLVTGQLDTAKAQLKRALASQRASIRNKQRMLELKREALVSQLQVDTALSEAEVAAADVVAARARIQGLTAQLRGANTTLAYTKIYSPIDGVVINRAVDPGQTVAASFSAPVLFVIAQDLAAMQVLADIDEADVGKVTENLAAQVSVDAFPGEQFEGTVTQLRYSPTETQGVVTYAAVLDVANDELKLRPGMTATVSITTQKRHDSVAVPNSALRYRPKSKNSPAPDSPRKRLRYDQRRLYHPIAASPGSATEDVKPTVEPLVVQVGITDGLWTEIVDGAPPVGTEIVTRETTPKKNNRRKVLGIF